MSSSPLNPTPAVTAAEDAASRPQTLPTRSVEQPRRPDARQRATERFRRTSDRAFLGLVAEINRTTKTH